MLSFLEHSASLCVLKVFILFCLITAECWMLWMNFFKSLFVEYHLSTCLQIIWKKTEPTILKKCSLFLPWRYRSWADFFIIFRRCSNSYFSTMPLKFYKRAFIMNRMKLRFERQTHFEISETKKLYIKTFKIYWTMNQQLYIELLPQVATILLGIENIMKICYVCSFALTFFIGQRNNFKEWSS